MKQILLGLFATAIVGPAMAQKKNDKPTAFAITGAEKGQRSWTEVNLVDVTTGEVISPVYQSSSEVKRLNARTGKPIRITSPETDNLQPVMVSGSAAEPRVYTTNNEKGQSVTVTIYNGKVENLGTTQAPSAQGGSRTTICTTPGQAVYIRRQAIRPEMPFATTSAALAYDKKNDRLYYTPMGISQLRYIDLKAKSPTVYYFEDEAFGSVKGHGDIDNQITRMVIASDGNGYALTNDAKQLIRFTTKKKPEITNLGPIVDDAANGKFSVSSRSAYGGDMVADDAGNLYLITANRRVYKIGIENRTATFLGSIKGLPDGFTTNGAVVENDKIVVTSSTSTRGYFAFDLKSLQAEKLSSNTTVFNASDLANGNLLRAKKKDEEKQPEIVKEQVQEKENELVNAVERSIRSPQTAEPKLAIYPNPITNFVARLSLTDYPAGNYDVQLLDLNGRLVNKQSLQIMNKNQVSEVRLPQQIAKGTYLLQVRNDANQVLSVEKLVVQ